ncbi:TonB-dependent receptor [Brevundimonas sp. VNH65]|uniref:TonB-dependent receptor n=1 Tax=Brevundimonas sp. VNH65 TaxID=3400917 RepID=UPI003C095A9B
MKLFTRHRDGASRLALSIVVTGSVFLLSPGVSLAGDEPAPDDGGDQAQSIADVVVTAERRATSLLRTPGSITPVSGEDLRTRKIEGLNDLSVSVPGLSSTGGAPQTSLYIRGIGTSDPGSPPSVGVYIDDVYNPRAFGNNLFDLPDVQGVEVLRGPQGTLYGQNTTGGAIKITSRDPGDAYEGSILLETGNYSAFRTQVYLAGPIRPGVLSASVAYTGRKRDGYTYNQTLDYWADDVDTQQARLKLRYTPNDRIEAVLAYSTLTDASDTQAVVPLNYGAAGPRVTYSPRRFNPSRDVESWSLRVTGELTPHLTVKSISAWRALDNLNPNDASGLPDDRSGFIQFLENRQWSQELQLLGDYGRLNFVAGAVWRRETFAMDRNAWQNRSYSQIISDQTVVDTAVFGQANYNLTARLRLTAGLRFGSQTNEFDNAFYRTDAAFNQTALVYSVEGLTYDDDDISSRLGADFQINDDWLSYASWSRGSKAGGFNRSASNAQIAEIPVRPETVTAYEVGVKGRALDNRVQGSLALFYNDFQDFQATITNPVIDGQLIVGNVVANAAQATTYGVELETTVRPLQGLEWRFAASWLDATFDSFANPTGNAASNYAGKVLPFASEWIVASSLDYVFPVGLPGELSARLSGDFRSAFYSDNANREAVKNPDQFYVNLGLTYRSADHAWTFQALAKNLFDETTIFGYRTLTASLGVESAKYIAPRLVTFSVRRTF